MFYSYDIYICLNMCIYIYIYRHVFFSFLDFWIQSHVLFSGGGGTDYLSPSPETLRLRSQARLAVRCALLDGMLPSFCPWPPSGWVGRSGKKGMLLSGLL